MPFKKNLRGADTYAMPSTPQYRDNYDRIFGKREADPATKQEEHALGVAPCEHKTKVKYGNGVIQCTVCGESHDGEWPFK